MIERKCFKLTATSECSLPKCVGYVDTEKQAQKAAEFIVAEKYKRFSTLWIENVVYEEVVLTEESIPCYKNGELLAKHFIERENDKYKISTKSHNDEDE